MFKLAAFAWLLTAGIASLLAGAGTARAQEPVKIGLITPLTGPFASTGREMQAAAQLYMAQHGDIVAGRKVVLIVKDDANVADATKRLAQELVVNDKVAVLAGMGLTPLALSAAQVANQAKVPLVVMGAATSTIPQASPYIVRTSFSVPVGVSAFARWAAKSGAAKTVVSLVSDYAPGLDTEKAFKTTFEEAGGRVIDTLRTPLASPDFSPYLQRAADLKPDALFIFVPSGLGATLMRQYAERGLAQAGMKLLATGDILDEQLIDQIGDSALGLTSAYHYSDGHPSELNERFTREMEKNTGERANMMAVGGYDGMALIYKALEKTGGKTDGPTLLEAMKGLAWESPRGPVRIDPQTRDMAQNIYLRRVERKNGRLVNVEQEVLAAPSP